MTITTNNPASRYGMPVILDDDGSVIGSVMDYADGIRAIRRHCALSTAELGAICGVSRRTVEGWECGRTPSAAALNAIALHLGDMLTNHQPIDYKNETVPNHPTG